MKYLEGFRKGEHALHLIEKIKKISTGKVRLMEFCGGHTITLLKYGIPQLLPEGLEMLAGPGCPVCVTAQSEVDYAIELSQYPQVILTSFGDMLRVPGSKNSLNDQQAMGTDIRIVYSPDDAVRMAQDNPDRKVVFFAIGFETTAPVTAAAVKMADNLNLNNFYIFSAHKTTPGILKALLTGDLKLDGFICPGHVTAITGISVYDGLVKAGKPSVVAGFEPIDMIQSIYMLLKQINENRAEVEVEYSRVVKSEGNKNAQILINEVFEPIDACWRGIGTVKNTGLRLRSRFSKFDALKELGIKLISEEKEEKDCICGMILKGLKKPLDCSLFCTVCNPENPVGACMVSDEGTCSVYYRFNNSATGRLLQNRKPAKTVIT